VAAGARPSRRIVVTAGRAARVEEAELPALDEVLAALTPAVAATPMMANRKTDAT
jgi:hypothetical protein